MTLLIWVVDKAMLLAYNIIVSLQHFLKRRKNLEIGLKIKELRKQTNMTQEELAQLLNVSNKIISRWENEITYPDITMIPIIANLFSVSTDYLLGMDNQKNEKEIEEVLKKVKDEFHKGNVGIELIDTLKEACSKYPSNYDLKMKLFEVYLSFDEDAYYDEMTKLGNMIINNKPHMAMEQGVYSSMFHKLYEKGDLKYAEEVISPLPWSPYDTRWWLWQKLLKGEDKVKYAQRLISEVGHMFYYLVMQMYCCKEVGKRDVELLKIKQFLDSIYEDGDYGYDNINIYKLYLYCALDQAQIKNTEKVLIYLKEAIKYCNIVQSQYKKAKKIKHTSFLVDKLVFIPNNLQFSGSSFFIREISAFLEREEFNYLSNNKEFVNIKNKRFV